MCSKTVCLFVDFVGHQIRTIIAIERGPLKYWYINTNRSPKHVGYVILIAYGRLAYYKKDFYYKHIWRSQTFGGGL